MFAMSKLHSVGHLLVLMAVCGSLVNVALTAAEPTRRAPPAGIPVPTEIRGELEKGLSDLGEQISEVRFALRDKPGLRELLPDVEIFHKAVQWPLLYSEFYRSNE